jgi:hypothetical protein
MNRITLDQTMRSKPGDVSKQSEICDEQGKVVGYYLPLVADGPSLYRWAEAQVTPEELERRAREPGGKTTAEILERLGHP